MKIFIDSTLIHMKNKLLAQGYEVVETMEPNINIIICDLKNSNICFENFVSSSNINNPTIIDIGKKNISDIEYIINNKIPMFQQENIENETPPSLI